MTQIATHLCTTCGFPHRSNFPDCLKCRTKVRDLVRRKRCVVCSGGMPEQKYRPAGHYCTSTCANVVNLGRNEMQPAINAAIKRGAILPAKGQVCVDCGAPATRLDHRYYLQPLNVEPVCAGCNIRRGPPIDVKAFVAKQLRTEKVMGIHGVEMLFNYFASYEPVLMRMPTYPTLSKVIGKHRKESFHGADHD